MDDGAEARGGIEDVGLQPWRERVRKSKIALRDLSCCELGF